jgi:hypothetical protein
MRHPAQHLRLDRPRLRKIPFGIICAIAVFLTTPATYGQRAARGHFGGPAGHSRMGMSSRPSRGVPWANLPGGYRHVPASLLQIPVSNGGPRLRLQLRRQSYLGYGVWPLYGWVSSWEPDCAPYSGWDCYGNEYSDTEAEASALPPPAEIRLNSVLVIYLRNGSGYGTNDYWIADGKLNFVTTYNSEKSVVLEDVDWQRTVDDNANRGLYFTLRYAPSKQRYKPSIAPTCSIPTKSQAGSASSAVGGEAQSFGVTVSSINQGSKVTFVRAGSPAAQLGISPGDIVLRALSRNS